VRHRAHGPVDDDLAGAGDVQGGGLCDRVDGETRGPHGDRGREGRSAGGGDAVGLDGGDGGVLVDGDAEPVEDRAQMPGALAREPVAEAAAGGEGDVEVRAGLGDLGHRLHAGETAADHDHGLPGGQAGEAFTQPERSGPAGDLVGVFGGAGHALVVPAAAEGVHEGVVGQFLHPFPGALRTGGGDGDGLAVHVEAGDLSLLQCDAGALEHLAERAGREVLADGELVHPDALDEVGLGVDEGDGDVLAVQSLGDAPGGGGSGVAGSEDDDAVLHGVAPVMTAVSSGFTP
jgi:hypothetical protein